MIDRFILTGTVEIPTTGAPVTIHIPGMRTVYDFTLLNGDVRCGVYCTGTATRKRSVVTCQCAARESGQSLRGRYNQLFHKNVNGGTLEIDGITLGDQAVTFTPKTAIAEKAILEWRAWGARQLEVFAPPSVSPQTPPVEPTTTIA